MTLNNYRPYVSFILEPCASALVRIGLTPNRVSVLSLVFAILAGVSYYYSYDNRIYLVAALVFVILNSFTDAVDGVMARLFNMQSDRGDFLDHVIDRYADTFIICGIFFAGYVHWMVGVAAITGVLITSYMGTQAQAVGGTRHYGGIMGRADRLALIIMVSAANIFYTGQTYSMELLGWTIVVIAVTSHFTAMQRFLHTWGEIEGTKGNRDIKNKKRTKGNK
ncbi:MAG: CDP-alcohol phosphatidyltransferase family protein [Methanosarcinales archaeon]|nr:CDP-alcohol phosphatidyltransferase family protein [Methanosarcinales archaeon]